MTKLAFNLWDFSLHSSPRFRMAFEVQWKAAAPDVLNRSFSSQDYSFSSGHISWVFLSPSNQCCFREGRHWRWGGRTHLEAGNQYGISLSGCVTSAFVTFPRVSLEMVAMITQCPQLKIFDMWTAAFILSHLLFINCVSLVHSLFLHESNLLVIFLPYYIPYAQNTSILSVPLEMLSFGL